MYNSHEYIYMISLKSTLFCPEKRKVFFPLPLIIECKQTTSVVGLHTHANQARPWSIYIHRPTEKAKRLAPNALVSMRTLISREGNKNFSFLRQKKC